MGLAICKKIVERHGGSIAPAAATSKGKKEDRDQHHRQQKHKRRNDNEAAADAKQTAGKASPCACQKQRDDRECQIRNVAHG